MISQGQIFSKIPVVFGKYLKSLMLFNTILVVNITGNLMKERLCLVDLNFHFTTQICRSILGMCPLALAKLTIGPLDIYAFSSHMGANYPSARNVVIWKPRLK